MAVFMTYRGRIKQPSNQFNYRSFDVSITSFDAIRSIVCGIQTLLEMWANAQRDGRPAEYTWRPLFNAAKFG